jgi:hypothetical protein
MSVIDDLGVNQNNSLTKGIITKAGVINIENHIEGIPDLAAVYDFSTLPLGPVSLFIEPKNGLNLVQTTGSRQPIGVDYLGSRCLYFDGSDDYMDAISTTGLFSGKDSGTIIVVHAREDKSSAMNPVIYSRASNTVMFQFRYSGTTSNLLRTSARMSSETIVSAIGTENKADGALTYGIATATRNGNITIKQRGIAKISTAGLGDFAFTPTSPAFTVGTNYNSTEASRTDYFKGWIKAIYCFNRALTDDEVSKVESYILDKYGV